jgi:hypothetical protein
MDHVDYAQSTGSVGSRGSDRVNALKILDFQCAGAGTRCSRARGSAGSWIGSQATSVHPLRHPGLQLTRAAA